jgi:hypothetical protein
VPLEGVQGTPAAAKRKIVGDKHKRKASSGWGGAWGCGAGMGGLGRVVGRLVCLSSEEEAHTIAPDVQKNADTGANATQEQQ